MRGYHRTQEWLSGAGSGLGSVGTVANVLVGELSQSCGADGLLFQVVLSLRVLFRKYPNSFVFIE